MVKNILPKVETVQFMSDAGVCVRRIAFNQQTVLISTSDQYILIRIRTMMRYKIVAPAFGGYSQKIE